MGLYDRIKDTINKLKPTLAVQPALRPIKEPIDIEEPEVPEPIRKASYINEASIVYAIRQAARHRLLVQVYYNLVWRYVEPYSMRMGKYGTLFYGHDLTRNNTRSFYIHKIVELKGTDIPFNPRWFIEIQ